MIARFKRGDMSLEDEARCGTAKRVNISEMTENIHDFKWLIKWRWLPKLWEYLLKMYTRFCNSSFFLPEGNLRQTRK